MHFTFIIERLSLLLFRKIGIRKMHFIVSYNNTIILFCYTQSNCLTSLLTCWELLKLMSQSKELVSVSENVAAL